MNYETVTAAADGAVWKKRLKTALIKASLNLAVDSPAAGMETRRDALARSVLAEPDLWVNRFSVPVALGFIADADLSDVAVTDPEMDTRILEVWNDFLPPA